MKNKEIKLSANEINRYTYCPYQWYYGKVYGQKALKEKYQALAQKTSRHEGNFKKGIHFHQRYYRMYKLKRLLQIAAVIIMILMAAGGILKWWQW